MLKKQSFLSSTKKQLNLIFHYKHLAHLLQLNKYRAQSFQSWIEALSLHNCSEICVYQVRNCLCPPGFKREVEHLSPPAVLCPPGPDLHLQSHHQLSLMCFPSLHPSETKQNCWKHCLGEDVKFQSLNLRPDLMN